MHVATEYMTGVGQDNSKTIAVELFKFYLGKPIMNGS